ncbi:MAG TPA: DUF2071 domain-containing protein [Candidatus Acidoferrales bacterium]|nr:DUF2071 domain-containing protein [Candidatus Acidoferrales bacterium]
MPDDSSPRPGERVFLSAEWRNLVMLNYEVAPSLLQRYVPAGTELDSFERRTFISLVGFRFLRTKLFGAVSIPFHANFDEVNLRFYVRREIGGDVRRGVVFIREIVPRAAIALVARLVYGEKYSAFPMRHSIKAAGSNGVVRYEWRLDGQWCGIEAQLSGYPAPAREGSLEQFITEHYWGYSATRGRGALEYHVSHVPWRVWASGNAGFHGDADALYGPELGAIIRRPPDSAFVADGSPVLVFSGKRIS